MRLNIYRTHPGWATSDEIEFAMAFFLPDSFCPPVLHHDLSLITAGVAHMPKNIRAERSSSRSHLGISNFGMISLLTTSYPLASGLSSSLTPTELDQVCVDGNCCTDGLLLTFVFLMPSMRPTPRTPRGASLIPSLKNQIARGGKREPHRCCARLPNKFDGSSSSLGVHLLQPCSAVSLGGMEGQASTDSPMQAADPWQFDDPWKSKKKQVKQWSTWEDLQLQADHPFVAKDKTPLPFVQKQQLSTNRGGIAFVSKGNLQQARETTPKEACALLLSLIDPTDPLAKLPNLSGPFEVIVFDLNKEYKRQVHLLVVTPQVNFALPTPAITLTLAAVCEIVLERDARLTTKDVFQAFYDNPLAKFNTQLKEVCTDPIWGHAAIYGYRAVQEQSKEKHDLVHQCLLKVQQKHRVPLLSVSGHGDLIVRDFVAKGEQVQDLSIIPRFWPIDRANKADLIKAASTIAGYRGIAVTKRGLAPRFATDALATARDLLLPQDDRICAINKAMVPKVNMDSLGWPSEILAKDIVSAVHQATKVPCIPTRLEHSHLRKHLRFQNSLSGSTTKPLRFCSRPYRTGFPPKGRERASRPRVGMLLRLRVRPRAAPCPRRFTLSALIDWKSRLVVSSRNMKA